MTADPRPKPTRQRGRLAPVGDRPCQACGWTGGGRERAHLLRGAHKEDHEHLIMVLCGPFGNPDCRLHPRLDANEQAARAIVRSVMKPWQKRAIIDRRGQAWFEDFFGVIQDEEDAA